MNKKYWTYKDSHRNYWTFVATGDVTEIVGENDYSNFYHYVEIYHSSVGFLTEGRNIPQHLIYADRVDVLSREDISLQDILKSFAAHIGAVCIEAMVHARSVT
jgi:hypothetical protein